MKVLHLVEKNPVRKGYGSSEYDSYTARYEFSRGIDIHQKLDFFAPHADKMEILFAINVEVGRPYKICAVTSKNIDEVLSMNQRILEAYPNNYRIDIYLDNGVKVFMNDKSFENIYARSTGNDKAWRLEEYFA